MKYKIKKVDGETSIFDENGNEIYWEAGNGVWIKWKYDENGKLVYWEDSDGDKWEKYPIIEAKDLDECLEKMKNE